MHDAPLVRELQCLAYLGDDLQKLPGFRRSSLQQMLQVHAGDIFHRVVHLPVGCLTKVIHRDDVRMIELCQCMGLPFEAFRKSLFVPMHLGQQFDGHGAVQAALHRLVNSAHSSPVDELQKLIGRNQPVQFCRRRWSERLKAEGLLAAVRHR